MTKPMLDKRKLAIHGTVEALHAVMIEEQGWKNPNERDRRKKVIYGHSRIQ